MFRRLFTPKMINWSLPFSSYPNTDCPTWCRQIRAAHRVEVVAVGQVAAHQFGSQVFADFVAQVGIPYRNRLPAHIVMLGFVVASHILVECVIEGLPCIVAVFIDTAVVMKAHACFQPVGKEAAAQFDINRPARLERACQIARIAQTSVIADRAAHGFASLSKICCIDISRSHSRPLEGFVAHFVFQTTEYVQAAENASGIEAGGQLGTTADLPVELFEFEIVIPVDNVFGLVMEVVNAEIHFFHFRKQPCQIMNIADLPVFCVFGLPAVAVTGE